MGGCNQQQAVKNSFNKKLFQWVLYQIQTNQSNV